MTGVTGRGREEDGLLASLRLRSTVDPIRPSRERPLVANPSKMDSKCFGPGWAGDFVRAPHTSSTEQGWMVKGGIAASALAQAAQPGGGFPGDGNGSPPVGRRFNRPRMVSTDRLSAGAGAQARVRRRGGVGRAVRRSIPVHPTRGVVPLRVPEGVGGGRDVTPRVQEGGGGRRTGTCPRRRRGSRGRRAWCHEDRSVARVRMVPTRARAWCSSARPPRAGRLAVPRRTQQTRGGLDCSNHACKRLSMKRSRHPLSYAQGFCGMGRTCSLCRHELLPAVCTRTIKHSVSRDAGLSRGMPCPHRTA